MIKLSFEWGSEAEGAPYFDRQEFWAESYELIGGAVVMRIGRVANGFYFHEIGVPIAGLTRWFVGDGSSYPDDERDPHSDRKHDE